MALRAYRNLTIRFGLVGVGVSIQPLMESDNGIAGKTFCGDHKSPIKMVRTCSAHGHVVDADDVLHGYDFAGSTVYMTPGEKQGMEADKDGTISLTHYLDLTDVDPLYVEKSYLAWAQKGSERAFDLMLHFLRRNPGKALAGECVLEKTTRLLVIRYSEDTGTLLAHVCNFEANIRRGNLADAQKAQDARPDPSEDELRMVEAVFATLTPGFDPEAVENTYAAKMQDAIAAKAGGVIIETPVAAPTEDVPDLIAALKASLAATERTAA